MFNIQKISFAIVILLTQIPAQSSAMLSSFFNVNFNVDQEAAQNVALSEAAILAAKVEVERQRLIQRNQEQVEFLLKGIAYTVYNTGKFAYKSIFDTKKTFQRIGQGKTEVIVGGLGFGAILITAIIAYNNYRNNKLRQAQVKKDQELAFKLQNEQLKVAQAQQAQANAQLPRVTPPVYPTVQTYQAYQPTHYQPLDNA